MVEKPGHALGKKMVRWLSPLGLFVTGLDVVLSGIFGHYSDKRELEAAIDTEPPRHLGNGDVWVDFVADLGDGFDSTYGIAWLLSRPQLDLGSETVSRGSVLVMGGDEVYPRATWDGYDERLIRPYRAAGKHLGNHPHDVQPLLYAIPGNHDWYDGLTSFMRIFSRNRAGFGWDMPQQRSYFALQLADDWWLLGLDIAFDYYIDDAQVSYFAGLRGDKKHEISPGDKIILCTGKPSWASEGLQGGRRTNRRTLGAEALEEFEDKLVNDWHCHLPLVLSGDLHHYSRYQSVGGKQQRITFGGGGAYLFPTHPLGSPILWGSGDSAEEFTLEKTYPTVEESRTLRRRTILGGFANPSFGVMAGIIYILLATQMRSGLQLEGTSVYHSFIRADWVELLFSPFDAPIAGLLWIVLFCGLVAFADAKTRSWRVVMGLLHTAGYMATLIVAIRLISVGASRLPWADSPTHLETWLSLGIGAVLLFVAGWLAGSFVMGLYLWVAQYLLNRHPNEAFAALHLTRYKGFLRMKLDHAGRLWLYPIGVDRACTKWEVDDEFIEPGRPLSPHLIEAPIVIEVTP